MFYDLAMSWADAIEISKVTADVIHHRVYRRKFVPRVIFHSEAFVVDGSVDRKLFLRFTVDYE